MEKHYLVGTDEQIAIVSLHNGFASRADSFPIDRVLGDEDYKDVSDIVVCGHSAGGAVAAIIALRLRSRQNEMKRKGIKDRRITCFTFGAPIAGDMALRDFCEKYKLASTFVHFVNDEES